MAIIVANKWAADMLNLSRETFSIAHQKIMALSRKLACCRACSHGLANAALNIAGTCQLQMMRLCSTVAMAGTVRMVKSGLSDCAMLKANGSAPGGGKCPEQRSRADATGPARAPQRP